MDLYVIDSQQGRIDKMGVIKKAKICFISNHHVSIMRHTAQLTLTASMSFIISLAEYLEHEIKLQPPNLASCLAHLTNEQLDQHLLQPDRRDHFQPWCDYLFELVSQNKIMQANDEIFFIATVPEEYFNNFLSNHSEFQSHRLFKSDPFSIKQRIKEALHQENLLESTSISKKIAIINFSASVANLDRLKPKIHIEGLYTGQFYQFGDRWRSYRILNNDVPSVEEINSQNVLLLSGSSHSVNNLCPPMKKFAKNLLVSLSVNKQLKILGTCFGHQFLAHLNGASVAKRNFVKGTQNVSFDYAKKEIDAPFLQNVLEQEARTEKVFEYHNEHVTTVPKGFLKVGESESCGIESLVSTDKRFWSFQFHPEYSSEYISSYEQREATYQQESTPQQKPGDLQLQASQSLLRTAVRKFFDYEL